MSDHSSRFVASLVASGVSEVITLPIDVAKVRLQVQNTSAARTVAAVAAAPAMDVGGGPAYSGMADCMRRIAAEEGPASLWKGLPPSLVRQCCYTSCSLVLYEPIRDAVVAGTGGLGGDGTPNFAQRLLSGGSAGAISIAIFNWTEVLKTRMQTSRTKISMSEVFRQVLEKHGVRGFWAGLKPNVARTFLVNAAELGTYDQTKSALVPVVGDNAMAHLGASSFSGVCSALVSTPADVIKTRLMNAAGQSTGVQYRGVFDAFTTILRDEGGTALYKGFVPICTRKIIWCSSFFVLYEQLRAAASTASAAGSR